MSEELSSLLISGADARKSGALDNAAQFYSRALAIRREIGIPLDIAHTARHLGDIYRQSGDLSQSEQFLAEAIQLYRANLGTKILDLANALRPLALLKSAQGDHKAARLLWSEAKSLYSSINVAPGVDECNRQLSSLAAS